MDCIDLRQCEFPDAGSDTSSYFKSGVPEDLKFATSWEARLHGGGLGMETKPKKDKQNVVECFKWGMFCAHLHEMECIFNFVLIFKLSFYYE